VEHNLDKYTPKTGPMNLEGMHALLNNIISIKEGDEAAMRSAFHLVEANADDEEKFPISNITKSLILKKLYIRCNDQIKQWESVKTRTLRYIEGFPQ
jgi:hypothetical protein